MMKIKKIFYEYKGCRLQRKYHFVNTFIDENRDYVTFKFWWRYKKKWMYEVEQYEDYINKFKIGYYK